MSACAADLADWIDPKDTQVVISRDRRDTRFICGADDRLVQVLGFGFSGKDLQTGSHRREEFLTIVGGPFLQQQLGSLACGTDHLAIFTFRESKNYRWEPSQHIEFHCP